MSREELIKKFNNKVEEVKESARKVKDSLDKILLSSKNGIVILSFEEAAPKDDVIEFRCKIQEIIDMDITPDNIPTLDGSNMQLVQEYFKFDRLLEELINIKIEIMLES